MNDIKTAAERGILQVLTQMRVLTAWTFTPEVIIVMNSSFLPSVRSIQSS